MQHLFFKFAGFPDARILPVFKLVELANRDTYGMATLNEETTAFQISIVLKSFVKVLPLATTRILFDAKYLSINIQSLS